LKHYCITIIGNDVSQSGFDKCKLSSESVANDFEIKQFQAMVPKFCRAYLKSEKIEWRYPWVEDGLRIDIATGLELKPYPTRVREKRISCFVSHYRIWKEVVEDNEPALVLEHDAFFTRNLDYDYILDSKYDIIGINDPRGCTRKSKEFYDKVVSNVSAVQPVPRIDSFNVPQGLAGNSAYIIKPSGAKQLIDAAKAHGAWPNDALMCYQLIQNLGVTNKFYTSVQGLPSTTTG
jgi:GR25 family glycosyltransferase involved in LPS biosynthesis